MIIKAKTARQGGTASKLITTLGVEPQVATITLDRLLANGEIIDEVVVIYTESPAVLKALHSVSDEFAKSVYPGITLRTVPVVSASGPVEDFLSDDDLKSLLRTVYSEVRHARQAGGPVHFCISGGRKVMGIMGMVVAQLLFGHEDHLWHLVTEGWQPGSGRLLHLPPEENVRLVSVPVLRWNDASTLVQMVAEINDPAEVVAWYEKLNHATRQKRREEFIGRWLTKAERDVVRLICQGLDNATIAARLYKREQTVANQLRNVYAKMREWSGYKENISRNKLIAEFLPYFSWAEEQKKHELRRK
ncbi:CRISPR-associated protein Csx14 [Dethiobacter alkaliphilus]|uniref:CRISPR-associated protein Csx14 n=1 Tax=Dethiobacter alkaliphilus TaxID=427926 RepID=UPI002226747B|nr:CRISPR-associated protein Csx14 [Dethiobacter alkaliphilus]MCW3488699.1 CRISPR-associated protein Csx14 [Dethiobacter alkaliphilus]